MAALCVFFCPQTISLLNLGGATGPAYVLKFQGKLVFLLMFISWKTGQQTWLFQMLVQCNQSVIVHAGKGKLYYCCAVETDSVLLVCMLFLENLKVSEASLFFFSCLSVGRQDSRPDFFKCWCSGIKVLMCTTGKGNFIIAVLSDSDSVWNGLHAFTGIPLKEDWITLRVGFDPTRGRSHWISSPTP